MQVLNLDIGIDFGPDGNLHDFEPVGFSPDADAISTWSEAPVVELMFRLPPVRHDLRFAVEVFPYLANGRITQQNCWIYFNGLFVHFRPVREACELMFTVARDRYNPRANRLSFALPDATSPSALGIGQDLRQLGLSFIRLTAGDPAAAAAPEAPATPALRRPGTPAGRARGA